MSVRQASSGESHSRLYGYDRASTSDQNAARQVQASEDAGCVEVYKETASGARMERKNRKKFLDRLQEGDTLVVWRLDRLARSLKDVLMIIAALDSKGIGFRSLTENIDTTTASSRMIMHIVRSFAESERSMLEERTKSGLDSARNRGQRLGRPDALTPEQKREVVEQVTEKRKSQIEMARLLGCSRTTIHRVLVEARQEGKKLADA